MKRGERYSQSMDMKSKECRLRRKETSPQGLEDSKGVAENEGIEISISANLESLKFIIEYLSTPNDEVYLKDLIQRKVTNDIFLNFIVTADFLKVKSVYWAVINQKLKSDFVEIMN